MAGIPITLDFDVQKESPLEPRTFGTQAPWVRHATSSYIYNGFLFIRYNVQQGSRGLYMCIDSSNLANSDSWEKIGADVPFDMTAYIAAAPVYADETAATAANLPTYTMYKTPGGLLRYKLPNGAVGDTYGDAYYSDPNFSD